MVNMSENQVIMRSVNTTITSVLPVLSLLLVGSVILGAATLQEFSVALLVGLISGTYSSVFVAAPVLVWLKEREEVYADVRERLRSRLGRGTERCRRRGRTAHDRRSGAVPPGPGHPPSGQEPRDQRRRESAPSRLPGHPSAAPAKGKRR